MIHAKVKVTMAIYCNNLIEKTMEEEESTFEKLIEKSVLSDDSKCRYLVLILRKMMFF